MIKKTLITILFLFFYRTILSQTYSEQFISRCDIPPNSFVNYVPNNSINNLKFDESTGTYVFLHCDSTIHKNNLYSNKGNTTFYDEISISNIIFDSSGNYYSYAGINNTDYFLKNGMELYSFNGRGSQSWVKKNNKIYFIYKDFNKYHLGIYDIQNDSLSRGEGYDLLFSIQGFTDNYSIPYYTVRNNNEYFSVIGDKPQKISIGSYTYKDKNGALVYVAIEKDSLSDKTYSYIIQGDQKFKKFEEYISFNGLFNSSNLPIYKVSNRAKSFLNRKWQVYEGDHPIGKSYVQIDNLTVTPLDKILFLGDIMIDSVHAYNILVYDGKEINNYKNIYGLKVLPDDKLLFASPEENRNATNIFFNDMIYKTEYQSISEITLMPNDKLAFGGSIYKKEDYNKRIWGLFKNKNFVQIGDEKIGPYYGPEYEIGELNEFKECVIGDSLGNYIYKICKFHSYEIISEILYSNTGQSEEHLKIFYANLFSGKPIYFTADNGENNYSFKYCVYYNFQPICPEFDDLRDYKVDLYKGLITFIGLRNDAFYKVNINL